MTLFRRMPAGLRFWHPAALLATWGGVGLTRVASGTCGSLAALPFAWAIAGTTGALGLLVSATMPGVAGIWAAHSHGRDTKIVWEGKCVPVRVDPGCCSVFLERT